MQSLNMDENGKDYISFLPDELLCFIISLLPFESAVQTSLLSAKWRSLWNLASVRYGALEDVVHEVSSFFTQFNELEIKHPRRLHYHFGSGNVLLASVVADDKLHLDFSSGNLEFPWQFDWELNLNCQNLAHPPSASAFFVKSLCLKSVSHLTNQAVSSLVSNMQLLEDLKITRCNGFRSLCIGSSTKLQRLTIFDCPDLRFLHVKCSKLRSFRYRGLLPRLCLENHFNLHDAMLDFRQGLGCNSLKISDFDPILLTIKNATILTLCRWNYEALIWPSLSSLRGNFKFYNLKELWWIDYSNEGYNGNALITFLHMCPALERLFVTIDHKSYSTTNKATYANKEWNQPKLEHLKLVSLEGFAQDEEILFIMQIKELVSLEPLFISTIDQSSLESVVGIPSNQLKSQSFISIRTETNESNGSISASKLIDDVNETRRKHPHMKL